MLEVDELGDEGDGFSPSWAGAEEHRDECLVAFGLGVLVWGCIFGGAEREEESPLLVGGGTCTI